MITIFHGMMHRGIDVYGDDIIIKSRGIESHVMTLRKVFKRLKKYHLKLNPTKCVFGAKSGKLLRFIISKKGIKIDLDKSKAIQEMPSPKAERVVHSFLRMLNYISRFTNLAAKVWLIFKLLRKNNTIIWDNSAKKPSRESSNTCPIHLY